MGVPNEGWRAQGTYPPPSPGGGGGHVSGGPLFNLDESPQLTSAPDFRVTEGSIEPSAQTPLPLVLRVLNAARPRACKGVGGDGGGGQSLPLNCRRSPFNRRPFPSNGCRLRSNRPSGRRQFPFHRRHSQAALKAANDRNRSGTEGPAPPPSHQWDGATSPGRSATDVREGSDSTLMSPTSSPGPSPPSLAMAAPGPPPAPVAVRAPGLGRREASRRRARAAPWHR